MEIKQAPSPNHFKGRSGQRIIAIVDHITAGLMPGCLSWMQNPKAKGASHYLVTRKGEIYQLVKDSDAAWGNGEVHKPSWPYLIAGVNPNSYTVSIEHEGVPTEPLTEPQYQASLWLHKQLIAKYAIPIDRDHIIGHYRIDSVNRPNCPGPKFPWGRLFADLTQKPVKIVVGNKTLIGYMDNGVAMVAVREIAGDMGFSYGWDAPTQSVIINGTKILVTMKNDLGYAPLRTVATVLGRTLKWDAATMTATVL